MPFLKEDFLHRIRNIRENVNIFLYDSKPVATRILNVLSVIAALAGVAGLIAAYGFDNGPEMLTVIRYTFKGIIAFYYLKFFVGYLYSFSPRKYFSEYRLNAILLGIILFIIIYKSFTPTLFTDIFSFVGIQNPEFLSSVIEQVAFLILLIVEIGRASSFLPSTQLSAQKLFVLSFLFLIFAGSALLMLPLTGCGSLLNRDYSVTEPHSSSYYESEDRSVLRAERMGSWARIASSRSTSRSAYRVVSSAPARQSTAPQGSTAMELP